MPVEACKSLSLGLFSSFISQLLWKQITGVVPRQNFYALSLVGPEKGGELKLEVTLYADTPPAHSAHR